jgi:PAS domain S-box-containing protein
MVERRLTPTPEDAHQEGGRRWTPATLSAAPPVALRAPLRSAISVVLIGLSVAALLYSVQRVVARNQRIQVRLAEMEGSINLLNAREWEARTGFVNPEHQNDVPTTKEHLLSTLAELRQWTGAPPPAKTAAAAKPADRQVSSLQQVQADITHYLAAVDSMFGLIDQNKRPQALSVAEQMVDPAFEDLRISLATARSFYATAGERAINRANVVSLAGVLFAMLLIWWLLGRAARQRTETQALATERRTLAASEARWRALILNGEDAVLVVDPTGTVGYASPNADRVLGLPPGGLGDSVLSALPPDLRPAMLVLLEASQREPGRPRVQELQLASDGAPRFLEVVATNLVADPAIAGIVLNLRDLTERRAMEVALRESQEQLLHAQKMEALGRLAGGIAHDFNNLMMAISGYTELVLQDPQLSATSKEDVAQIRRAVFRAAELTQQILAYSRRQMLQPVPVSLNLLLGEASGMLRRLMPENIELRLALDPKLPDVLVDPGHMLQVVMNLALNARDAMPNGGTLGIRTTISPNGAGDDGAESRPAKAQLIVSDTGTGIDPKVLPLIFDPFFTTKAQGEGSGLGLSTVYGIVKQSGGQIDVDSEMDQGTTFTISIPAAPPVVARDESIEAQGPARSGGEVILVVEDDDQVRTVVSKGLPRLGYEVMVVRNAEEALALVDKHPGRIDLLLTDVVMPGLSGPQLADRLVARRPETRVVFMSGYPEAQDPALGFSLDGRSYLQKPFALAELAEKIRQALDE